MLEHVPFQKYMTTEDVRPICFCPMSSSNHQRMSEIDTIGSDFELPTNSIRLTH